MRTAFATGGMLGKPVTSVPLYGLVYGLYYNKKMFADAGLKPPTTWQELQTAAKKLTDPAKKQYGMVLEGASYTESVHFAFIFGRQNGGQPFDAAGKATFTSDGMVNGVKQYVDLMGKDKVVNPSNVQYKNGPEAPGDFAKGKAAMLMSQNNADNTLQADGMKSSEDGVVRIQGPSPGPAGGSSGGSPAGAAVNRGSDAKTLCRLQIREQSFLGPAPLTRLICLKRSRRRFGQLTQVN